MKKLIVLTAACIVTLITPTRADQAGESPYLLWSPPPVIIKPLLKTIPIILEPIVMPWLAPYWAAVASVGVLMEVEEELCEPLENHKIGVGHDTCSMSASVFWPDGEYPGRDWECERVYDYDPKLNVARWWIRLTHTTYTQGGEPIVTRDYSNEPPLDQSFTNEDVQYEREAEPFRHESTFIYDSYEVVTAYCYRKGSSAWPRPVMAIYNGYNWKPVWRNDYMYHSPLNVYVDYNYCMIGPEGVAYYKPHWEGNTELPDGGGVATLFFAPGY